MVQNGTVEAMELQLEEQLREKEQWLEKANQRLEEAMDTLGCSNPAVKKLCDEIIWNEFEYGILYKLVNE